MYFDGLPRHPLLLRANSPSQVLHPQARRIELLPAALRTQYSALFYVSLLDTTARERIEMQVVWAAHRMVVAAYSERSMQLGGYIVRILVVQCAMLLDPTQVDRKALVQRAVARSNGSPYINAYFLTCPLGMVSPTSPERSNVKYLFR